MRTGWLATRGACALTSGLAVLFLSCPSFGAGLSWSAPADCERAEIVRGRVEELVGRPLGDVAGLDFGVEVTRDGPAWKLALATRSGSEAPSTRMLSGRTCIEVTDAAAVAMAMAIEGSSQTEADGADGADSVGPMPPPPAAASPADSPRASTRHPPAPPGEGWSGRVGLGAVLDTAALPDPTLGLLVGGGVQWAWLRIEGQLDWFPPQRTAIPGGASGQFDLLAGALLACAAPEQGRFTLLGCGGLELGQLSGEASGVTDPELGKALWIAARAEAALAIRVGAAWHMVPRLGIAIPLQRTEFVLDDTPVHRPAALSLRAGLGMEFSL